MIEKDLGSTAASASAYSALLVKYEAHLSKIQGPLPPAKTCTAVSFCDQKPTCYTDFTPHFNKQYTLTELIVGKNEWVAEGSKFIYVDVLYISRCVIYM